MNLNNAIITNTQIQFKTVCDEYLCIKKTNSRSYNTLDLIHKLMPISERNGSFIASISDSLFQVYDTLVPEDKYLFISKLSQHFGLSKFVFSIPYWNLKSLIDDHISLDLEYINFDSIFVNIPLPKTADNYHNFAMSLYELCFLQDIYTGSTLNKSMLAYNLHSFLNTNLISSLSNEIDKINSYSIILSLKHLFDQIPEYAKLNLKFDSHTNLPEVQKTALYQYDGTSFTWNNSMLTYFKRHSNLCKTLFNDTQLSIFNVLYDNQHISTIHRQYMDMLYCTLVRINTFTENFEFV